MSTPAERDLRFCIQTSAERSEIRYFAHPQDYDGTTIRLTSLEREQLCHALAKPGTAFIPRDDSR